MFLEHLRQHREETVDDVGTIGQARRRLDITERCSRHSGFVLTEILRAMLFILIKTQFKHLILGVGGPSKNRLVMINNVTIKIL